MKRLYALTNFHFTTLLRTVWPVYAGMVLLSLLRYRDQTKRTLFFEDVLDKACKGIWIAAFLLLLLAVMWMVIRHKGKANSFAALRMLPVRPGALYASFFLAACGAVLLYLACAYGTVWLCYWNDTLFSIDPRAGGSLLIGLLRADFFWVLLPQTWGQAAHALFFLFFCIAAALCVAIQWASRAYLSLTGPAAAVLFYAFYVGGTAFSARNVYLYTGQVGRIWDILVVCIAVVMAFFMIYAGYDRIRKSKLP